MAQILQPQPSLSSSLGSGLGQGLAQGLAGGINSALEMVMKQRMQQQQMGMLSQALGLGSPQGQTGVGMTPNGQTSDTATTPNPQRDRVAQIATNPQAMMALESINPQAAMMVQKMHESNLIQKRSEEKKSFQEKGLALKETKGIREGIDKAYSGYKDTNRILEKMEKLNKPGALADAWKATFAEATGIPLSVLSNPESEEFQKLSQNLMRGVTQYGNRILQVEFDNFMKQIPTLKNSEEGRRRIINNMKIMLEPARLEYEAKKQILKENKGIPPIDLYDQIQERVGGQFEKEAQKFETGNTDTSMAKMPSANQLAPGKMVIDDSTGKAYRVVNGKYIEVK